MYNDEYKKGSEPQPQDRAPRQGQSFSREDQTQSAPFGGASSDRSQPAGLSQDVSPALEGVIEEGCEFVDADACLLLLYDGNRRLRHAATFGFNASSAEEFETIANDEPLSGYLARLTAPVISGTAPNNGLSALAGWASTARVEGFALAPVCVEGASQGLILFGYGPQHTTLNDLKRAFQMVANIAALLVSESPPRPATPVDRDSRDRFISALSHELRTPLTSIIGFTQIIRKRLINAREKDERLLSQVDVLWAQAQRLNRLIDTFVDVSHLERGEFSIDLGKVELVSTLKRAADQSLAQARSSHRIVYDLPDHEVEVYADLRRLDQVFSQVLSNAIRFSPEKEPILVSCEERASDEKVVISVIDRGPGIPDGRAADVFKQFSSGGPLRAGGLGVGLFVSKSIIEAHGGTIALESVPQKGTTVRIVLPK